jgi:vacuolar protein sorting-associated protein 3
VLDLHDSASAEIYCTLGGAVVSPKTAHALGERFQLQPWAALVAPLPSGNKVAAAVPLEREKTVDEGVKRELTKILLEVYMSGGLVFLSLLSLFCVSCADTGTVGRL